MTTCPSCGRPEHDGLLCQRCTRMLTEDLHRLPEWLAELETTMSRQTGKAPAIGGKSAEIAAPANLRALNVYSYVRNQLQTWVRELDLGDGPKADNPRAWIDWLAERIQRMRMHPAVDELIAEIDYCHKLIRRAVDRHDDRISVGRCEVCTEPLMASPDAEAITCRKCERAGIETIVEVAPRRRQMLADAEQRLLPRDAVLRAVPLMWRVEINRETFRSWVKRGRLKHSEVTPSGTPLYRLRDVLDLAQREEIPA